MGNEYHTIACGLSSIIIYMELVEGKARPVQLPPLPYNDQEGKTAALILRMTKPIWNTGLVSLKPNTCFSGTKVMECEGKYNQFPCV